jgi:soluble lytic murein transglycosylase
VEDFLQRYQHQPVATRMRSAWLHQLGKRRDWQTYLRFYQPQDSVTLQCYQIRARLQIRDRDAALKDALKLWLVGYSQPDACDPAFKQLYASSLITSERIWERIRLAFANHKSSLAGYLAKRLSAEDREWVKRWQFAHSQPTAAFSRQWASLDTPLVREILVHATKRLARHKPEQAWKHWLKLSAKHDFSSDQNGEVLQLIALHGALRRNDDAANWLAAVPEDHASQSIQEWRVRTALLNKDWNEVIRWIQEIPPAERSDDVWRYWLARAQEKKGDKGDAFTGYARVAEERSFYGFLAADHLQRPYAMNDEPLKPDPETLENVTNIPGIQRARELRLIGRQLEARREWYLTTSAMIPENLQAAAVLAHRWGWHDRAILTAAQAQLWSDLALRFPLPHRESVFANAEKQNLDPAIIYGVIRQESAFMEDAHSSAGAMGLMQLMPATGRQTAQSLNIRYLGSESLLHSDQNIRLGSAYLRKLLNRFNESMPLSAAAYNAGPHRVDRWLPTEGAMNAAIWMEAIPFKETRKYVKRVLAYATIFDWRLRQPLTRLSSRLADVQQKY